MGTQANNNNDHYSDHPDDLAEVFISPEVPVFTTGVVCRLLGVPVWILKQLDAEGIVSPPRESDLQSRLYSHEQLRMVKHCWYYIKKRKVKINGLKIILELEGYYDGD